MPSAKSNLRRYQQCLENLQIGNQEVFESPLNTLSELVVEMNSSDSFVLCTVKSCCQLAFILNSLMDCTQHVPICNTSRMLMLLMLVW